MNRGALRGVLDFFAHAKEDVDAVVRADPAARSKLEVVLAYPGIHAVWLHRAAHASGNAARCSRRACSRT